MQLLTEWEGRTGEHLARGRDVRIEHRAIKRAKDFSVWPDLTHSVNEYYHAIIIMLNIVAKCRKDTCKYSMNAKMLALAK